MHTKPSDAGFSAVIQTPINADRKQLVTSYLVWLSTISARMSLQALVTRGLTEVELFDSLSGRTRFAHFCAVFNCILQLTRNIIPGRFVKPIFLDKCVTFCDPCLNYSQEISPEGVYQKINIFKLKFILELIF